MNKCFCLQIEFDNEGETNIVYQLGYRSLALASAFIHMELVNMELVIIKVIAQKSIYE
jgi:hypothetical protein